jgi:hypothetical protein
MYSVLLATCYGHLRAMVSATRHLEVHTNRNSRYLHTDAHEKARRDAPNSRGFGQTYETPQIRLIETDLLRWHGARGMHTSSQGPDSKSLGP